MGAVARYRAHVDQRSFASGSDTNDDILLEAEEKGLGDRLDPPRAARILRWLPVEEAHDLTTEPNVRELLSRTARLLDGPSPPG